MNVKALMVAVAMLFTVTVFAQGNEKYRKSAHDRVENMAQTVKLDEATKDKLKEVNYEFLVAHAAKKAEGANEAMSALSRKYFADMKALIPADQMQAYNAWLKTPYKERYKAVPGKPYKQ